MSSRCQMQSRRYTSDITLADNPTMHSIFVTLPLLLTLSLAVLSSEECEKKGFGSSLLCSSCDKLASFVGDSGMYNAD